MHNYFENLCSLSVMPFERTVTFDLLELAVNFEKEQKIKKMYTTTTERKSFGELFLASKKNFPGRWWIQKPYENQETISTTEILPLWPPFFLQRKVLHWRRAVYAV